ncbi:hypothetical protein RCH20_000275 [Psychrobacter sp. PL15]|uniref:hypothetical protein n=1 Tax=Psychrobacter sp. PL15 TaxID=3071719 RepID=UPI002E0A81D7|nr:hypothetical protein [Psychrobacter sp. PL15]
MAGKSSAEIGGVQPSYTPSVTLADLSEVVLDCATQAMSHGQFVTQFQPLIVK